MANLYSQYFSGTQLTAGTIVGSALGTSGLNAIVDRLNSIASDNSLVIGSVISGTSTNLFASNIYGATSVSGALVRGTTIIGTNISGNTAIRSPSIFGVTIISGPTVRADDVLAGNFSGTTIQGTNLYGATVSGGTVLGTNISGGTIRALTSIVSPYQNGNVWNGSQVSGTTMQYNGSAGFVWGDHPLGSNFRLANVIIGTTGSPTQAANLTPIGTLYFQYTP